MMKVVVDLLVWAYVKTFYPEGDLDEAKRNIARRTPEVSAAGKEVLAGGSRSGQEAKE